MKITNLNKGIVEYCGAKRKHKLIWMTVVSISKKIILYCWRIQTDC